MDTIEIIGLPQSNFVWAARIACAEKGVPHVSTVAAPHAPEVRDLHPLGRIPVLRHGAFTLAESQAIARYVDRAFAGPSLMPRDLHAYARAEQWLSLVVTSCEPLLIRQYLFAYLFPTSGDGSPDRARIDGLLPSVTNHLRLVERAVESGFAGGGDAFTLVDAFLVPILFHLRRTPEAGRQIGDSRRLAGYLDAQLERPSVRDTLPA